MNSRPIELFRRARLLVVSGALAMGSLAVVAGPAHATGTPTLSIAPANSATCPVLTITGSGFTANTGVQVHLFRNGSYVTTFSTMSDGAGSIQQVAYNNHFMGTGAFTAEAVDNTHNVAWSNRTAACSK